MKKYVVLALLFSGMTANSDNSYDLIVVSDHTNGCVATILEFE
jgi:hypothetical protein